MSKIRINGKIHEYPSGTPLESIANEFQKDYSDDIVLCEYNRKLTELTKHIREDGELSFITSSEKNGRRAYKRSAIFLMQKALEQIDPKAGMRVLYSMGTGYYCVLDNTDIVINEAFLNDLDDKMRQMVEDNVLIKKTEMNTFEAQKLFKEMRMHNKENLLKYRSNSKINVYDLGGTKDYFYGYMVPSAGYIKQFKLQAYDEGFFLLFPDEKETHKVAEFKAPKKLFNVLKESTKWSSTMGIPTVGALNDVIASGRYQDMVLVQEALMEERIGNLAREIASRNNCKFVMIAGPSSSGKTTFSHRLSIQLRAQGLTPHPLPLDNYYLNRDQMPIDEYGEKDFEALEALDIKRFNEDMVALLDGKEVETPIFNFKTGKREATGHKMKLEKDDVLVIEGIHGLNDELSYSLPVDSKYKIYISALNMLAIDEHNPLSTSDGRLLRRIVRDARTRGTSAKDTLAMWASVQRGENKNIFPFQEEADAMFNSALIYELAIMKVYAGPQLYAISPDEEEYAEAKRLLKLLDYVLPMPTEDIANNSLIREFIGGSCFNT